MSSGHATTTLSAAAAAMALAIVLSAHDMGQSVSRLTVSGAVVTDTLSIDLLEIPGIDADRNGKVSYAELDGAIAALFAQLNTHLLITGDRASGESTIEEHHIVDEHEGRFVIAHRFAAPVAQVRVTSTLGQVGRPDHQHLVSMDVAGRSRGAILDASNPSVEIDLAAGSWTGPGLLVIGGAIALMLGRYGLFLYDKRRRARSPKP